MYYTAHIEVHHAGHDLIVKYGAYPFRKATREHPTEGGVEEVLEITLLRRRKDGRRMRRGLCDTLTERLAQCKYFHEDLLTAIEEQC